MIESTVIHGDCQEVLRTLPAGAFRLAFADPPYNIGIDYGSGADADLLDHDDYLELTYRWLGHVSERLTPDGSLWVLVNWELEHEVRRLVESAGYSVRQVIVWYETFGVACRRKFNRTSRPILWCVRDPKRFVFNRDAVTRPSDRQTKYNDKRANPAGKLWDDVWCIPRLAGTHRERIAGFPTQLPLRLLEPIVGCATDPGDAVLDPFSGSGTTLAAAAKLGRRYVGIERNADYVEGIRRRLERPFQRGLIA